MQRFLILIFGILAMSCQDGKSQSSNNLLTAKVQDVPNGTEVYITEYGDGNQATLIDTVNVEDGKFTYHFPDRNEQMLNSIKIQGASGFVYVINESEPLEITIMKDENNFLVNDPEIKGGEANTLFVNYMGYINENESKLHESSAKYSPSDFQKPEVQQALRDLESEVDQDNIAYGKKAIKEHPNTLSAAYILADLQRTRLVPADEMKELYRTLSDEIRKTSVGQELGYVIDPPKGVEIGDTAPNFSALTPDGKELSLKEVLAKDGKYTLVEFWASWCPNCQEEMPHVVDIYKDFHDKGLNIIGVSIDKEKSEWVNAIQDYGMDWDQVSNLKYWQDPIVRSYGVNSIPTNYLLDENGKVIAIKLLNQNLRDKLEELLND